MKQYNNMVLRISRLKVELESEIDRRVLAENQAGELQRKFESQNTSRSDFEELNLQEAPANERKGHLELHEGHADAAKERHLVQQSLFSPDEENSREEDLDLVILEEPHLPVSVPQVSLPVTGKNTLRVTTTPWFQKRSGFCWIYRGDPPDILWCNSPGIRDFRCGQPFSGTMNPLQRTRILLREQQKSTGQRKNKKFRKIHQKKPLWWMMKKARILRLSMMQNAKKRWRKDQEVLVRKQDPGDNLLKLLQNPQEPSPAAISR